MKAESLSTTNGVEPPRKRGRDLSQGDALVFLGDPHLLTSLSPYDGPHVQNGTLPEGTRIARSREWAMTVCPDQFYEVLA